MAESASPVPLSLASADAITPEVQGREVERLGPGAPPVLFLQSEGMSRRFWEFFTAQIPNPHTRRAYYQAISQFSAWCHQHGVEDLRRVEPIHVAAWVEDSGRVRSRPTVKQHLAAVRMLFDKLEQQLAPLSCTDKRNCGYDYMEQQTPQHIIRLWYL